MSQPREAQLLEALGIEELEPQEQEEILNDLGEIVFKGSLLRMFETMDEHTKEAFEKLLAADPSDEELQDFLAKNVPQADQAVNETVEELTSDILAVTGESQD
jgi:succinate dehydrogenase flavin-adding protein (antitoxin of CptAB toxin-antitoxin module)